VPRCRLAAGGVLPIGQDQIGALQRAGEVGHASSGADAEGLLRPSPRRGHFWTEGAVIIWMATGMLWLWRHRDGCF
jgi:hypothetical protein